MEEYQGMKAFILGWIEKAEALVTGSIVWSSASQLQEQIRAHQVSGNERLSGGGSESDLKMKRALGRITLISQQKININIAGINPPKSEDTPRIYS